MEPFAFYLLKSVIWLSGFALVFFLFLRNERFFLLNRLYLIAGILTSLFFPFISVHYAVDLPLVRNLQVDSTIDTGFQSVSNSSMPDAGFFLFILYLSGVLFVTFMIIKQSRPVLKAIKKAEIITSHPVKIIRTAEYISSFSFFSYVFVNPSVTDVETREIVNHELVHIRQLHWFDLVLVELLCMLQWFNPLVWIYIRFIRQNHEYLADEVALQQTSDPAIYKAALLNQIVGFPVVNLANSFNYSLNLKRFNMMKNIISSPYRKMKIFLILPVFALVLYAFAKPEYRYSPVTGNSGNNGLVSNEVRGTVVQQDGKPLEGAMVTDTLKYLNKTVRVPDPPKPPEPPAQPLPSKSVKKSRTATPPAPPAQPVPANSMNNSMSAPPPPPTPTSATSFKIINTDGSEANPLFVIDGVVIEKANVPDIDPNTISSMNVLKDKAATDKYGDKANDGVIEITTKQKVARESESNLSGVNVTGDDKVQKTGEKMGTLTEELPEFPGGGEDAMVAWIIGNLNYPGEAAAGKITGKVYVDFVVGSTGKVKNVQVNYPVHPLLDAEAKRVIESMPDWKPGAQAGRPVAVQIRVPVEFKLR